MTELSGRNFGLIIAYVLPGMVLLLGISAYSPTAHEWLVGAPASSPAVAGFLYVLLASVALGMTASAVRFLVVDSFHHRTGIVRPAWDVSKLIDRLPAVELMVEYHFRYYQFHANMLIAVLFAYPMLRMKGEGNFSLFTDFVALLLLGVFAAVSRDNLRNYYGRVAMVLGTTEREVTREQRLAQRGDAAGEEASGKENAGIEGDNPAGP